MALENCGGKCLGFCEINKDAIETYSKNFNVKNETFFGDIKKIEELPPHDILTAGVPCQSWSIAGKNLGFDDDRGQLWNDTIYLLRQSQPKAFIFENVKGLTDPRNREALSYIMERIKAAGYFADYFVINSLDYGVPQNRVRVYIIGFLEEEHFLNFKIPEPQTDHRTLGEILFGKKPKNDFRNGAAQKDLFGEKVAPRQMSLSSKNGFNDYFLFNDIRNGLTTIHSWDIIETTERQKEICYLLLKNRRKKKYGKLDGNPLSLQHFQELDSSISQDDLDELVSLEILKGEEYLFSIQDFDEKDLNDDEKFLLEFHQGNILNIDELKANRVFKIRNTSITKTLESLKEKGGISVNEIRYDFKNTKISTGLNGVNRVFLPSSDIFPTLVASDTNDFISFVELKRTNEEDYKRQFLEKIYRPKNFRKIIKSEACRLQGFPEDFQLPEARARWMKLVGNSISVPVIETLCQAILKTSVLKKSGGEKEMAY